ncbi:DUF1631 family protein [Lysobacter enzymogenes]|uniref:DUF1631 family protein n=1 Tax=Lysobacter enzymogenes TaxID=69 RepID=UPI00384CC8C9
MNENPFQKNSSDPQMVLVVAQGLVQSHLAATLGRALQQAEDQLQQQSLRGRDAELTAVRDLRRARSRILQRFEQQVGSAFEQLQGAAGAAPAAAAGFRLSLVSDDGLVEQLAAQEMVENLAKAHETALGHLERRLVVLSGRGALAPSANPCHPKYLGDSLNASLGSLYLTINVRVLVYRCVEQELRRALGPLYERLNAELAAAGVLPSMGR